jgi:hypothetical protein
MKTITLILALLATPATAQDWTDGHWRWNGDSRMMDYKWACQRYQYYVERSPTGFPRPADCPRADKRAAAIAELRRRCDIGNMNACRIVREVK